MRIRPVDRKKLEFYLKEFYKNYPNENFTLFHFVRYFKLRLKSNRDAWVGVSGDTGVGKSYFVLMAMVLFGRPMDLEDNVAYIPKGNEIVKMFNKLNFQALLIDEAAREMRAVNWMSKAQQGVNTAAMTDRFRNNWVFLNMPQFNEFTKSMKRGNLVFRVVIPYRNELFARVIVQRKSRNWRSDDPWGDDLASKKYEAAEKKYKELSNEIILGIERSLPNTVMDFIVPNLALVLPHVVDEYERLKLESRGIIKSEEEKDKPDRFKVKFESIMARVTKVLFTNSLGIGEVKVSKKAIADSLGVSMNIFNKYLNMPLLEEKKKRGFKRLDRK